MNWQRSPITGLPVYPYHTEQLEGGLTWHDWLEGAAAFALIIVSSYIVTFVVGLVTR